MQTGRKNGAIGLILNGALVVIAVFSMLSGIYPAWSSWIFLSACVMTVAALGLAAKIAWRSEEGCNTHTGEVAAPHDLPVVADEGNGSHNSNSDAAKTLSSIKSAVHPDAYWKIIEQIALREKEARARQSVEDFSLTINIINVYTGAERRDLSRPAPEKIDFVLLPDLEEALRHEQHLK